MSSIEPETTIITIPSGSNIGLIPDTIVANNANFATSLLVAGVDIIAGNSSAAAHIVATSNVHGITSNVVGTTDNQTLANKTLTAPIMSTINNGGTLTLPSGTHTLISRTTTDSLTNKTINTTNNTLILSTVGGGTNVNSTFNQTLLTTSNVTFNNVTVSSYAYCNRNGSVGIPLVTSVPNFGTYIQINIAPLTFSSNQFIANGNTGATYNGATTKRFLITYNMSLLCDPRYIIAQLAINGVIVQGSFAKVSASSNTVYTNASASTVAQLSTNDVLDILLTGDLLVGNINVQVEYLSITALELLI